MLQHDPDVLVMQDADFEGNPNESLAAALRILQGDRQVVAANEYMIASRHPLGPCALGDISFRGKQRHFLRCTIQVRGRAIDVATVHLASPRSGLNALRLLMPGGIGSWRENVEDRLAQARALVDQLAGNPRPLILAGDFNSLDSSPVMGSLHGIGLRDAFASGGFGYGYTHGHSLRPGLGFWRIDHVLVSGTIGVRHGYVGSPEASDHRPVIADLWLVRAR